MRPKTIWLELLVVDVLELYVLPLLVSKVHNGTNEKPELQAISQKRPSMIASLDNRTVILCLNSDMKKLVLIRVVSCRFAVSSRLQ